MALNEDTVLYTVLVERVAEADDDISQQLNDTTLEKVYTPSIS